MKNIVYVLWILWHALKAASKWPAYLQARSLGLDPVAAKHVTYHKADGDETWELQHFGAGDDIHYFSEHLATCSRCSYNKIHKRAWLRGDAWPGDIGSTFEEAKEKAKVCTRSS